MIRNMTEVNVKLGLKSIVERVEIAYKLRPKVIATLKPTLVAVSKTKPTTQIIECYNEGQRHFGENYVQELCEKGTSSDILEQCKDIKWHFIGHLQRNKINKVLNVPGLYMIETVDSEKLASSLNSSWEKIQKPEKTNLKVLVQVNTSSEEEKNGVSPLNVTKLYKHILENCKHLDLSGIMTIGRFGHDPNSGPNPDFIALMKCYEDVCQTYNLKSDEVNVSMGMSDDFEQAIEMGSTIVRVGSSIFGYRPKKHELTTE